LVCRRSEMKLRPGFFRAFAPAIALCLMTACSGDRHREPGVSFVHATDPHLFIPAAGDTDQDKKAAGDRQESLNQKAFTDVLHSVQSAPEGVSAPTFVVLTGDLGGDPCDITKPLPNQAPQTGQANPQAKTDRTSKECVDSAKDSDKRKDQVQRAAQAFGSSVLKEIYLVAGNNDIANEDPDDVSLGYFNQFIDDVQKKLNENSTGVHLHNLTACYGASGGSSSCYGDVPKTSYRLIGFPSYSFKNKNKDGKAGNNDEQAKQFVMFRALLDQARQAGKQALILTHVPEIDDPYALAQDRYAAKPPDPSNDKDPKNPRSAWSTWNVTTKLLNDWKSVLESDTVAGVLAGHLHDSHKEIYRAAYNWSTENDHRLGFRKLFLAPPIAVKNQDQSPIQARGFSLITLEPDHIEAVLYWYNPQTGEFKPDAHSERHDNVSGGWRWSNPISWMWQLDQSDSLLVRLAILLIALVTAYLTVVAVWDIPPADNPLAPKKGGDQSAAPAHAITSPFASDFGKTVVLGFGGLAVAEIAKALGSDQPSPGSRWFYVVWFVSFFFMWLFGMGLLRAVAEGLRAMVAIPRYSLARRAENRPTPESHPGVDPQTGQARKAQGLERSQRELGDRLISVWTYWLGRFFHWVFSLRVPLLTGFDTFINLIQGKNQTMTKVFTDTIINQQRNVIRVADTIRKDLTRLIEQKVRASSKSSSSAVTLVTSPVRVNISVLSADQSSVFYISRSPGSALQIFPRRSVAWVSVFTGEIRWHKSSWTDKDKEQKYKKIVLFDNSGDNIAGAGEILLYQYYQSRHQDYGAFVVLPVPWPQRGFGSDYVKGAIHISFHGESEFETIWPKVTDRSTSPPFLSPHSPPSLPAFWGLENGSDGSFGYPPSQDILGAWCDDREVRGALINSIAVLGELLRGFNEVIYKNYIEKNQSD
jgi:hypothetical protein